MIRLNPFLFFILFPLQIQNIPPASLEVLFDGVPVVGGGWVLTVTLQATTDLESAEIRITPSEGLKIGAGDPFWRGELEADHEEVLEISLNLIGPIPQSVTIEAFGHSADGQPFHITKHKEISIGTSR